MSVTVSKATSCFVRASVQRYSAYKQKHQRSWIQIIFGISVWVSQDNFILFIFQFPVKSTELIIHENYSAVLSVFIFILARNLLVFLFKCDFTASSEWTRFISDLMIMKQFFFLLIFTETGSCDGQKAAQKHLKTYFKEPPGCKLLCYCVCLLFLWCFIQFVTSVFHPNHRRPHHNAPRWPQNSDCSHFEQFLKFSERPTFAVTF